MKTPFKCLLLMLITSATLSAQKHEIYKNSFDEELKALVLDLNRSYIQFEESNDGKLHIDYTIEFSNYSKKEVQEILSKIKTSAIVEENKLVFKSNSEGIAGEIVYSLESLFGVTFEGDHIKFKEKSTKQFRQSKQYFYDINSSSRGKSLKEYLKNIRELDAKKKKKKVKIKNIKSYKTNFIIKIPRDINIRATVINSSMTFNLDLKNQITLNARNTDLKFQSLINNLNNFDVVNGSVRANALQGGSYKFNHVDKVQLAEIKNLDFDCEFTDVKIGEVGENVKIVDFNSKFWIHNFSNNFGNFKMHTEYSEINMFFPENIEYYIETFGQDTVHYYGEIITEIPPSRKNESTKMMVIGENISSNKIKINTKHGIIRFGEDFIDIKK
ncbi:hypothetical protein [Winogradskyella sp.]|jgi:hypothetical protein|uniref:hypothetical protein n=1 Tax=Winogradskyella sp. TaxID=1883156 RepID=UPI0025E406DC|nr:hypothetical protein [Winogradskyella sp.]MCT4628592.1 hypothetical protein [Winogradskyella sp.]